MTTNQRDRRLAWALALGMVLCAAIAARNDRGGRASAAEEPRPAAGEETSLAALSLLNRKDVLDEVSLTPQQIDSIKVINQKNREAAQKDQAAGLDLAKLPPDEGKKKFDALLAAGRVRMEGVRKEIQAVLTPEQLKKLAAIELRLQAAILLNEAMADKLKLSDEQKDQLQKSRADMQRRLAELQQQIQKVQNDSGKAALEMLTPEQIERFKQLRHEIRPRTNSPAGGPPPKE